MRSNASPLLPVFRSRMQGEVLALLLADPGREWTVSEIAARVAAPLTSVQSEVSRLEVGGLLHSRKVGRARVVRANVGNPVVAPLTQVVLLSFGAPVIVAEEFAGLDADRIVIFGSWAARFHGEPGPPPADIDVLVVGDDVSRSATYEAAERAEKRLGLPVNPVLRPSHCWSTDEDLSDDSDLLVRGIRERAHVEVVIPSEQDRSRP